MNVRLRGFPLRTHTEIEFIGRFIKNLAGMKGFLWSILFSIASMACNPSVNPTPAAPYEGRAEKQAIVQPEKSASFTRMSLDHFSLGNGISLFPLDSAQIGLTSNAIVLLPDGSVRSLQMAQCSPDVTGQWSLRSGDLLIDFKETYELETCLGEKPPFKSKSFLITIVELECRSEDGGIAWGMAVTDEKHEFHVMCGDY